MKEIVIISGKGGTGKTSITAAFATLAQNAVLADCDVDAADLHLILKPEVKQVFDFSGGKQASIRSKDCIGCGLCLSYCKFDAVIKDENIQSSSRSDCDNCDHCSRSCTIRDNVQIRDIKRAMGISETVKFRIDPVRCEGCKVCVEFCPVKAIDFEDAINGQWFISDTRCGPMVHAKLGIAEENSGKLVTLIRKEAKQIAEKVNKDLLIVDGSPGIGCPVIASITGADLVLIVTEPTLSGRHDLKRVAKLTENFNIPTYVCINKADINPDMADQIAKDAESLGVKIVGRIDYSEDFTKAQIKGQSIVEYSQNDTTKQIKELWSNIENELR